MLVLLKVEIMLIAGQTKVTVLRPYEFKARVTQFAARWLVQKYSILVKIETYSTYSGEKVTFVVSFYTDRRLVMFIMNMVTLLK